MVLLDELYDNGFTLHNVRQKLVDELKLKEEDIFTCTLFQKPHKKQNFPLPSRSLPPPPPSTTLPPAHSVVLGKTLSWCLSFCHGCVRNLSLSLLQPSLPSSSFLCELVHSACMMNAAMSLPTMLGISGADKRKTWLA